MKIRRFFAADMRSALRQVRTAHGAEAVILSSRACEGGVEIISAIDYDEALVRQAAGEAGQDEDELAWVAAAVDGAAPPPVGTAGAAAPPVAAAGAEVQAQLDAVR
ncbi:MAG: flagellar biosynthesis protein FlhF, partial [Pseudomonadota bacterium]|nr:flagellar biosynthesis protein FlhF [Pseudomonadota bacterium]